MNKTNDIAYIKYVDNVPTAHLAIEILGTSSENKPTLLSNQVGSMFTCYDNGDQYIWSGSSWVQLGASILTAVTALSALVGDLEDLDTTETDTIVGAINEIFGSASTLATNVGDITTLETTEKASIVGAINELVV